MEHEIITTQRKRLADLQLQYDRLGVRIDAESLKLDGMLVMSEALSGNTVNNNTAAHAVKMPRGIESANQPSPEKRRRMRLGAKKRVVYCLVENGCSSLQKVYAKLANTDIGHVYARDVVKVAIEVGDFDGNIDGHFRVSPLGQDILSKARLPKNWEAYQQIITSNEMPVVEAKSVHHDERPGWNPLGSPELRSETPNISHMTSSDWVNMAAASSAAAAASEIAATAASAAITELPGMNKDIPSSAALNFAVTKPKSWQEE